MHLVAAEDVDEANKTFRTLVKAQHVLTIMSELHSTDAYVTRQPSSQILSLLRVPERTKTIQELCGLLRACTFAGVKLKVYAPGGPKDDSQTKSINPTTSNSTSGSTSTAPEASMTISEAGPATSTTDIVMSNARPLFEMPDLAKNKDGSYAAPSVANLKALKTVFMTIPDSLRSFLQGKRISLCFKV